MSEVLALSAFSQRFADQLFAAYPAWRRLGKPDPDAPRSLWLSVPSPVATRSLLIRSYGDQVTVDFGPDGWHEHFIPAAYASDAAAIAAALDFIDKLVTDQIVVTTRYLFGRRAWMRASNPRHVRKPLIGRIQVFSWSGEHDGP